MNLRFLDEVAFFSEYQNEPIDDAAQGEDVLTANDVMAKVNKLMRYVVPVKADTLTAYIDVQANVLFYVVLASEPNFTSYVIDYGTWPEQPQQYFTVARIRKTLQKATNKASLEGAIYAALEALVDQICGRTYKAEDGTLVKIKRCMIDAAWGAVTDLVFEFCKMSAYSAILTPAMGRYVGASSRPLNTTKQAPGTRVGLHWRLSSASGARPIRYIVYDTNFWKSFTAARLRTGFGEVGCLSLYGKEPRRHRLFADHVTAEYPVRVESGERVVDEWKMRPPRRDNHYWDCLVGAMVAASLEGCELPGVTGQQRATAATRVKVSFSELQRLRRLKRAAPK
jgi:phage terminase large subunit GpA-like protein